MKLNGLVALVLACMMSLCSSAQLKGFGIGPYAEMGWPSGDFAESNKNGLGVGLAADIRLGKLGLTGSVGYMHFGGKTMNTTDGHVDMPAINAVPVRVGLKYRFIPLLYVKLEGGVANYTKDSGSAFILSPGFGVRFLSFDVQLKYETWLKNGNNNSFGGIRLGYLF